jgi:hypothetical protein
VGSEIMKNSPYSPEIAPVIFNYLDQWKCAQQDINLKNDELKRSLFNWISSKAKTFHAAGVSNLTRQWKTVLI